MSYTVENTFASSRGLAGFLVGWLVGQGGVFGLVLLFLALACLRFFCCCCCFSGWDYMGGWLLFF